MSFELPQYNEEALRLDKAINNNRPYQQCTVGVLDTIADPNISFDKDGVSNYYFDYKEQEKNGVFTGDLGKQKLKETIDRIKLVGEKDKYDCILGLSGGADSSYLALLAKQQGLRPLVVHFDYGWNLELAVKNIENIVNKLNFELYTVVMDWEEMKSLQSSYYQASVLDLDVPADHAIFGALFQTAKKFNIKSILSGKNIVTEAILPRAWNYNKFDLENLKDIHKKYNNTPLKKLPLLGHYQMSKYQGLSKIKIEEILDFVEYNKESVKAELKEKLDWKDYGGKHYENVYTRFYQSYLLPVKFGIDKRKAHLTNLIYSNQMTKNQAVIELSKLPYDEILVKEDFEFVAKKLGFTNEAFKKIITQPNVAHENFKTDKLKKKQFQRILKTVQPLTKLLKKF